MEILQGYAYHIKDNYFKDAKDPFLMQNKEEGKYRPTLYCVKDGNTGLYWMVPITSQYDKFWKIRNKIIKSGKKCKGIVLGEYDDCKAAFLIQNMFPVTKEYIDHIHTKNGNPVPVKKNCRRLLRKMLRVSLR